VVADGAIGHYTRPFPEGAPTVKEVFERETGIELEILSVPVGETFPKIMQDITTRAGGYDVYQAAWNNIGDYAAIGGIVPLDEYVERYKPDFNDAARGYVGGARGVELLAKYDGKQYLVSLDGDFQTWIYRRDLFNDEAERAAYRERYGAELRYPRTFAELDQMAEFFYRPEQGLYGNTSLRNQGWGFTNWYQRYCSMASPNQHLFDEDGTPLIDGPQGVEATREYVETLRYKSPDAVTWGWPEQYSNMAEGGAAMTCAFANMPKFLDNEKNPNAVTGRLASDLPPGRRHGDGLVRRSVLFINLSAAVSSQSSYPEAAYLFLQWVGSSKIYTWITANPNGYYEPFMEANFVDPYVVQSFHQYHVGTIRETIRRAVPSINFAGSQSFHNALDENLLAALTGTKSPERAMSDTARSWKRTIRRVGEDELVSAIRQNRAAWPTIIDPL